MYFHDERRVILKLEIGPTENPGGYHEKKIGNSEWSLPVSGATAIEIAAEAGFEGMQIGEAGGRLAAFPLNNQKVQESYNQVALKYGIQLHSLNLGALLSEGTLNYPPDSSCGLASP